MKRANRKIIAACAAAALVVVFLYAAQVVRVNRQYPPPAEQYVALGTPFDLGENLALTVEYGELLTPAEVESKFAERFSAGNFEWNTSLGESKVFLIKVKVHNSGSSEASVPAHRLSISCHTWHNGIEHMLMYFLNGLDLNSETIFRLKPNETKAFTAPYMVYEIQFGSTSDFQSINLEGAYLAPALYPVKYCLKVV